jgi:hypothetical protein
MGARRVMTFVAAGAVLAAAGCGDTEERGGGTPRPAAAMTVSAAVVDGRMVVSPRAFGAGPIVVVISNQTARPQAVTFETDARRDEGPGLTRTTAPIDPAGTATLEIDVRGGRYRLSTGDRGIAAAAVRVGAPRPSAQGDLLTP